MSKRILSLTFAILIMISASVPAMALNNTKVEGIYSYSIKSGYATLTKVDQSAKGDIVLPSVIGGTELKYIGYNLFLSNKNITSVTVPEGVVSIESHAFNYCVKLSSVTLPSTLKTLGDGVFVGCESLTEITVPDGVTSIGGSTFSVCPKLEKVVIYDSVSSIDKYAFVQSPNVTIYGYPGTYAEQYAKESNIPFSPLEDIPDALDKTDVVEGIYTYSVINEEVIITAVSEDAEGVIEIPQTLGSYPVREISKSAFANRAGITEVIIPEGVREIGNFAFYWCENLKKVTIPSTLTLINSAAFQFCSSLQSVTISEGVKHIGSNAFSSCESLEDLILPNSLITIGDSAFDYCRKITEIVIPDGVKGIGFRVFYECNNLTRITLPKGLTLIDDTAFDGCGNYLDPLVMNVFPHSLGLKFAVEKGIFYTLSENILIRPGDVNENGSLELSDVSSVLKVIAKWDIEINNTVADVNLDNNVSLADVSLMLKSIAKWNNVHLY